MLRVLSASRLLVAACLMSILPGYLQNAACANSNSPAQITLLKRDEGKGKHHLIQLILTNRHNEPIWFVLPYHADQSLPQGGVFDNRNWESLPIGGILYREAMGSVVMVQFYGGNGFHAFRIPARGRIELHGWWMSANQFVKEID